MTDSTSNKQHDPDKLYDVIILGGGPAGLTAAVYTSRAQLSTLVFAGSPPGGQLTTTTEVENYPGFPEGITGPELIQKFRKQAERFGTEILNEHVKKVSGSFEEGFNVEVEEGHAHHAKTILIATGATARWLGLESEQRMRGKGVSACATCDAFFFKGKEVAVIGGGDSAMEEATFLTRFASKVHILVRKSKGELRASKIMQVRALDNDKIKFHYNTELHEVLGEESVSGIKVVNNKTDEIKKMPKIEGVFLAIGHKPNTEFLKDFIELDHKGYVKLYDTTETSKEGVFVAGDVADFKYRQAITAAGFGTMAALDLERFLAEKG
jgi:thioredoxin reductase (NADPH)